MRRLILRTLFVCTLPFSLAVHAGAQAPAPATNDGSNAAATSSSGASGAKVTGKLSGLDEVQRQLREQGAEIERLRALVEQQSKLVNDLRALVEEQAAATRSSDSAIARNAAYTTTGGAATPGSARQDTGAQKSEPGDTDTRLARVEEQAKKTTEAISKQLGSMTFSGDLRLRYEPIYGQQNALTTSDHPDTNGNPLASRQRLRLRLRFGARGSIGKEFEWGLRLATGSLADVNSSNQTLTDFFSRKPIALDQAYLTYKPAALPGFQVQGGKFEAPWTRTEMTFDNDIMPEGFNESYTRTFKNSVFKNFAFVAWQLPFLERNAAFVLDTNGKVNLDTSGRGGRDLALYGAQLRTRLEPTKHTALALSAANLFYSGTQFITPAQFFGANIQFPVTFTIPATATAPAQTITTQVSIPRDQLVAGNANLGFSTATNNAVNRDGRLASGYNLTDFIGRLDFSRSKRWPLMVLLNYVHNTQAHDVVSVGTGGASFIQPNHEDNGYWAEFQIGKTQQRGDFLFNYTFIRIQKDAVLTPFNFSDIGQQSDVRANRFILAYALDPRITLSMTGIFSQRPNGLLGVFNTTPPGSLNRTLSRLQFDTVLRF